MDEEFSCSPQDIPGQQGSETKSEEPTSLKRLKAEKVVGIAVWQPEVSKPVLLVAHTDVEAIRQLKEIESSSLPKVALSLQLQDLCEMFP